MKILKKIKYIVNLLIYVIIIVYSVEILLFIFSSDLQKSLVDIKGKRIEIAKKNNLIFDIRESELVFLEKRKKDKNLSVPFYYSPLFSNTQTFLNAKKNKKFIPFRGPINKRTLSCAEDLNYRIIENDKYGFKNSNSVYEKKIDIILLGGSYAEGFCYTSKNDISGNLSKNNFNTLNLGVATTGPLVSLAVLKEFGHIYKPKNVIFLYYENNNLEMLDWEKKDKNLTNYLKKNYKSNYFKKINEINEFLNSSEIENIALAESKANIKVENIDSVKPYVENLQDILELNIIRNRFKNSFLTKKNKYDLNYFYKIINEMNSETSKWNGNFTLIYVPSWDRFYNKSSKKYHVLNLRETIIEKLIQDDIEVLDLTNYFKKFKNLNEYYPLGYVGHFNKKGYKKIAEIIIKRISN